MIVSSNCSMVIKRPPSVLKKNGSVFGAAFFALEKG